MAYFAIFTIGYMFGVFTTLALFPPQVKEIEEQEKDAFEPILRAEREGQIFAAIKEETSLLPS